MKTNIKWLLLILGVLSSLLLFSACERSASTPPVPTMTPSELTVSPTFRPLAITLAAPGSTSVAIKAAPGSAATATPASPTTVPTAKPTIDKSSPYMGKHTVRSGETLYSIGRAYGVFPQAIAESNNLGEPYTIFPGQTLNIPRVRWPGGVPQGPTAKTQFDPNF
jgi:LysM repeat protein